MNRNDWVSPERLYLTADGRVVGAEDPARAVLLVAAGAAIPYARAAELGLVAEPAPAPAPDPTALSGEAEPAKPARRAKD